MTRIIFLHDFYSFHSLYICVHSRRVDLGHLWCLGARKVFFTPQFNHLIYLHLLLSPGLIRVYESIHQPHSSTYLCNDHVSIYFSCVNADLGLFYYHPNQKDVQMGLVCVSRFHGYLEFFLPSPLQMQAGISPSSRGMVFFTESPRGESTGSV